MESEASAPAAISIVNAIPTGRGGAVAIDAPVTARVRLDTDAEGVTGRSADGYVIDPTLIERCVSAVTERFGTGEGGTVETETSVPPSVGLKTSSAVANATVAATLDALGCWDRVDDIDATRLGVDIARSVGVTVTGALDDAAASMLGGIVLTDNRDDTVLTRDTWDAEVAILLPAQTRPTSEVDVKAYAEVAPIAEVAVELACESRYDRAMAVNGLAVATAGHLDMGPITTALAHTTAVSPSGTGPAIAAVGDPSSLDAVEESWSSFDGEIMRTSLLDSGIDVA